MKRREFVAAVGSFDFVRASGLMSYGADRAEAYHLTGSYVGRILNGEKPADLPVQQATKIELRINLNTAKGLGITVPLSLLGRAALWSRMALFTHAGGS
jgi:putative tryptophan/tyrosine transport system substrate-binding protein